jgi:hypothetical protein
MKEVPEVPDINRASHALEICGNRHWQLAALANATGTLAPADGTGNRSNLVLLRVGSV